MTPEQLTGLAALLIDFREWILETDPYNLDAFLVDTCVDVCARRRKQLVEDGAK